MDGGERLLDVGDAAVGDLLEVLRDERRGGQGEGPLLLVGAIHGRVEHVLEQRPVGGRRAVRGRGAAPSRRTTAEPSGVDADELQPLGETWPSPDLTSWVSRNSSQGSIAVVGRVDEDGALAEQVGVLFQEHVGHGQHQRVAGVHEHGAGQPGLVERLDRPPW